MEGGEEEGMVEWGERWRFGGIGARAGCSGRFV